MQKRLRPDITTNASTNANDGGNLIDNIILIAPSMYPNLSDARFELAVAFLNEVKKHKLQIIICDDSPLHNREEIKKTFIEAGGRGVEMTYFPHGMTGKKGQSIRHALSIAMMKRQSITTSTQQRRWAVVFTELEKVHFVQFVQTVVMPILNGQCDIVYPRREENLFRLTYAIEQYHMEMFGTLHLNQLFKRATGDEHAPFYDFLFGPIAWEGTRVSPFYLKYQGELWDAQMVPAVHALQEMGARWMSVTIPYRHHELQRQQEEGSPEMCEKRVLQYRLIMDTLGRSLVNPLPSPSPSPCPILPLSKRNNNNNTNMNNNTANATSPNNNNNSTSSSNNNGTAILSPSPTLTLGNKKNKQHLGKVIIVGSNGNLGGKIARYLVHGSSKRPTQLILIDKIHPPTERDRVDFIMTPPPSLQTTSINSSGSVLDISYIEWIEADVSRYDSTSSPWISSFEGADVVFVLAAKNPFPEASPSDAYESMKITSNVLEACTNGRVNSVVYFSSNHVVGQLRTMKNVMIQPDAIPNFGTRYVTQGAKVDSTIYASTKVAGEAQCEAMVASGRLARVIILRVGWCQPGENIPETMTLTGSPHVQPDNNHHQSTHVNLDEDNPDEVLAWFKNMYLKNQDLYGIIEACCSYGGNETLIRMNAVSNNGPTSRWVIGSDELGFTPT
jgi:nucleoside-diphosphate-sugar epimerase